MDAEKVVKKKYKVNGEVGLADIEIEVSAENESLAIIEYLKILEKIMNKPMEIFVHEIYDLKVEVLSERKI